MPTTLVLRLVKGSKLTKLEADTNFTNLRDTADGAVQSVVAGTNVTVDNTDPLNPVVNASGSALTAAAIAAALGLDSITTVGDTITLTKSGKVFIIELETP